MIQNGLVKHYLCNALFRPRDLLAGTSLEVAGGSFKDSTSLISSSLTKVSVLSVHSLPPLVAVSQQILYLKACPEALLV